MTVVQPDPHSSPTTTSAIGITHFQRQVFPPLVRAAVVLACILCVLPFLLIIPISVGEKIEGAGWHWAFTGQNYQRFFVGIEWPDSTSFLYARKLWFSFYYAGTAVLLAAAFALPFTWLLTRQSRRRQTLWIVFLLSSLSISEVFVVMGWDVLLSNRSGLPMVFRELGATDWLKGNGGFQHLRDIGLANPRDLMFKPSSLATMTAMAYLVFPYAVVLLYPRMSRIDDSMLDAARTMGATPLGVLRTVVVPALRVPLAGAVLILFVYLLGIYLTVSVFADPAQQTLTISMYDSIRGAQLNAPFGAAQAIVLLLAAVGLLTLCALLARLARQRS